MERYKPAVHVSVLYLLSGLMWSLVGIMLCVIAVPWIVALPVWEDAVIAAAGMAAAGIISVFGFSRVARKNIRRISNYPDRVCAFAFQSWKSYLNIAVMICMGWLLRHSAIPKAVLAPLYFGLGGALVATSALYYLRFRSERRGAVGV
jgi:hypothetical protein